MPAAGIPSAAAVQGRMKPAPLSPESLAALGSGFVPALVGTDAAAGMLKPVLLVHSQRVNEAVKVLRQAAVFWDADKIDTLVAKLADFAAENEGLIAADLSDGAPGLFGACAEAFKGAPAFELPPGPWLLGSLAAGDLAVPLAADVGSGLQSYRILAAIQATRATFSQASADEGASQPTDPIEIKDDSDEGSDILGGPPSQELYDAARNRYRRNLKKAVVDRIVDECIANLLHSKAGQLSYPDERAMLHLVGQCQLGKTAEMIALAYVSFFRHGLFPYMFLRNDATSYSDMQHSLRSFNDKIRSFIKANDIQCDVDEYLFELSTLQEREDFPSKLICLRNNRPFLRPLIRCRLATAQNVRSAIEKDLPAIVEHYGVWREGARANVVMFVDESQNINKTPDCRLRIEEALKVQSHQLRHCLQPAASKWLFHNGFDCTLALNLNPQLIDAVGMFVEVSATHAPSVVCNSDRSAQMIFMDLKSTYFGLTESVSPENRIPIVSLADAGTRIAGLDTSHISPDAPQRSIVLDFVNALVPVRTGQPEHVVVLGGFKNNSELHDLALSVAFNTLEAERPVVALTGYASLGARGPSIFLNKAAVAIVGRYLLPGEQDVFISPAQLQELKRLYPDKYGAIQPHNGTWVPHPHREGKFLILSKKTMTPERMGSDWHVSDDEHEICLPKGLLYRVRGALSIIYAAFEAARADISDLLVVTIGDKLMKEGLTLKTFWHDLAPTILLAKSDIVQLKRKVMVDVYQGVGRIAGHHMSGLPGRMPVLVALDDACAAYIKEVLEFNEDLTKRIKRRLDESPYLTIGRAARGPFPEQAVYPKLRQARANLGLLGWSPIKRPELLKPFKDALLPEFEVWERDMLLKMLGFIYYESAFCSLEDEPSDDVDFKDLWEKITATSSERFKIDPDALVAVIDKNTKDEVFNTARQVFDDMVDRLTEIARRRLYPDLVELRSLREIRAPGVPIAPITIAFRDEGDESELCIGLAWNVTNWLRIRCDCEEALDRDADDFVECMRCDTVVHAACCAEGHDASQGDFVCSSCAKNKRSCR